VLAVPRAGALHYTEQERVKREASVARDSWDGKTVRRSEGKMDRRQTTEDGRPTNSIVVIASPGGNPSKTVIPAKAGIQTKYQISDTKS
jgi:hypothetical protein